MIGIYKLMYTPTDDYYIGSSNNIKNRMHSHKSFFKNDKNIGALQELYNLDPNFDNFDYIVLEECEECDLAKKEKEYLELNIKDPKCLNHSLSTWAPNRGKSLPKEHRRNLAKSMIGKNGKLHGRDASVTFISPPPENKQYTVTSVKAFAERMGLLQSSMNGLANGNAEHCRGWTLLGTELHKMSDPAIHTLPPEVMQHVLPLLPDIEIVDPNGIVHKIKKINVYAFQEEQNIKIYGLKSKKPSRSPNPRPIYSAKLGVGKDLGTLDKFGRGWYVKSDPRTGPSFNNILPVYTFKNCFTNEIIENVISPSVLAKTLWPNMRSQSAVSKMRDLVREERTGVVKDSGNPATIKKHGWQVKIEQPSTPAVLIFTGKGPYPPFHQPRSFSIAGHTYNIPISYTIPLGRTFLTTKEMAEFFNVLPRTVRRWSPTLLGSHNSIVPRSRQYQNPTPPPKVPTGQPRYCSVFPPQTTKTVKYPNQSKNGKITCKHCKKTKTTKEKLLYWVCPSCTMKYTLGAKAP